jgi:hypothetical protein
VKKRLSVLLIGALMLALSAAPALAQPPAVTPPYEQGTDHANSICSFSGINDEPEAAFPEGGRVQSYGQLVRQNVVEPSELTSGPGTPGNYCNAHIHPYPENPPPPPG